MSRCLCEELRHVQMFLLLLSARLSRSPGTCCVSTSSRWHRRMLLQTCQHPGRHGYRVSHRKRKERRRKEERQGINRIRAAQHERRGIKVSLCLTCPPEDMSSRSDTKTASQFSSLTMKLKDKLHPRIRRKHSPTHDKPPDLNLTQNQNQPVGVLADQQRAVISSLQYFKALVDRLGLDRPEKNKLVLDQSVVGGLLGGASGGILEAVQSLVQLEPRFLNSKTVSACLTRLYRSVAQLIRWANQVMLQGVAQDYTESPESVTTVIRAVLNGAKELVRLVAERQDSSTPLSPVQSQTGQFFRQETSDSPSTGRSPSEEDKVLKKRECHVGAPPKPPMPLPQIQSPVAPPQEPNPPALPPKKRQSLTVPVPTHCRVAIVTPMIREPEDTQVEQDDCLKRLSSSSAESAANITLCEDDPDFDFLHTDLSALEALPPLPPALPEKRLRGSTGTVNSPNQSFEFNSTPSDTSPTNYEDDSGPGEPAPNPLSPCKTPPPLPEKKRHIHDYLQFCSSYSDQSAVSFYQKSKSRQREPDSSNQEPHVHLNTGSAPSPEQPSVPVLPPKKKQQDTSDRQTEENGDSWQGSQQEAELDQWNSWEQVEVEELLLTNQREILQRITMKSEEEEGPEVKAASADVLLVYATGPSSSGQDPYREAFLCTYRSFFRPSETISKLQHRYKTLCERQEPVDVTAAENTFQLLVRVVDDLSTVELDSGLLLDLMDLVFSLLVGGELRLAHLLHSNILSKMEKRWKLLCSPQSLCPLAAKGVAARPGTLLDFRSQDLAEQLTLLDSQLFYKIELPEVLLWSKEQNEERSPHLTEFTQHFNNVSFWVRSVIILQDKPQDRERLLLKFLKILKHLRKLNNFNSYLSILSALDSAPLRRLDWQRNTSETLEDFSSLIDSSSSFRTYREALAEVEPPCIPYLGLILQDLTFVHLGNPDLLTTPQGSKVNFSKCCQQFNILDTLRSYQQVHYSLQPDEDIISFFNDFSDHLAEEALWELSLKIRPKNTPRINQR
ncbi:rap guanine nucleotide exchange factor 1 [Austrofundulus limnaeus]|uniref:CRK SH3-binding GNRP n=1 Tax=Austrofundulus limnaeus TaxID=52670 RepID=A0A2I4CUD0_AUSLI|nr:PREDICTED: rap guanine nucleotide exchange factor 1-like [Austrofundulus limnaeus]